jgi:hypothetical protein
LTPLAALPQVTLHGGQGDVEGLRDLHAWHTGIHRRQYALTQVYGIGSHALKLICYQPF